MKRMGRERETGDGSPRERPRCVMMNFTGRQYGFSINDKIIDQWANLRRIGVDAVLVLIDPAVISVVRDEASLPEALSARGSHERFTPFTLLRQTLKLRAVLRELDDGDTLFYLRHPSLSEVPLFLHSRKNNLVVEINGLLEFEVDKKSLRGRMSILAERIMAVLAARRSRGFVSVTAEIGGLFHPGRFDRIPRSVISNGVNIGRYGVRDPINGEEGRFRILAVANFNVWHGIDRLLDALHRSDRRRSVEVHLVGDGPEKANLVRMVKDLELENVHFHPPLKGNDLDAMFNRCDIAIGVLAIERKGLREMSPLKHREYLARGMPFVMSGTDLDITSDIGFVHSVPSSGPIEMDDILGFIERMRGTGDVQIAIRRFAEENLDWSVKMRILARFLSEV